ncbi:MAG: 50S ribosomal protein L22 [Candidatus Doudnabacteria bacterium]|nr:50S ribosomal protein L22 [Candidatus Doudnabacteria bacterium]
MAQATEKLNTAEKATALKTVTAYARNLHIAPRKVRLVTNLVNGMPVATAITQLQFTNKKAAPMVVKAIKSAIANAEHNFSMKADDLFIKTITCDMGAVMKRYFPRARGSAFVIRRKTSHINVTLEERPGTKLKKKPTLAPKQTEEKEKKAIVQPEVSKPVLKDEAMPAEVGKAREVTKMNDVQNKRRPQAK